IIRFERHVYQAGSRVGALIEGSWRKVQPNATSSRAIAPIKTSGLDSQPPRTGSGTCTVASVRSFVSAIGLRDPLVLPGSRGRRVSVGPAKDTRRIHADLKAGPRAGSRGAAAARSGRPPRTRVRRPRPPEGAARRPGSP